MFSSYLHSLSQHSDGICAPPLRSFAVTLARDVVRCDVRAKRSAMRKRIHVLHALFVWWRLWRVLLVLFVVLEVRVS